MEEQGIQDAAILLMSLGEAEAAEVFKHLSPKEVQKLGEAIAKTRAVSARARRPGGAKFTGVASSQSLLVTDSDDYVRSVLKRALGDDKASLLIDRILQGGDISGIESLKWMDPLSRWPSCCATSTRRSWRPSWCTWKRTRRPTC